MFIPDAFDGSDNVWQISHIPVLVKSTQGSWFFSGDAERPVLEYSFRIDQMQKNLLDRPFIILVPVIQFCGIDKLECIYETNGSFHQSRSEERRVGKEERLLYATGD